MIDLLLEWPIYKGIIFFLVVSILLGSGTYIIAHYLIRNRLSKIHERVGRVLFRSSASLLALLVSFTFANQRVVYYQLKESLEAEASKLVDIHLDLEMYGTEETYELELKLQEYVRVVIEEGWVPLNFEPFNSQTVKRFYEIYVAVHKLEPLTENQREFRQNMLSDIDELSDYMQVRIYKTRSETPYLIYIASFGFIVVMILFSVYKPDIISVLFLSLYNGFIAMIIFVTIMMSNPLIGPLQIEPAPFLILRDAIEAEYQLPGEKMRDTIQSEIAKDSVGQSKVP